MAVGFALRQGRSTNTLFNCAPVHAEALAVRLEYPGEGLRGELIWGARCTTLLDIWCMLRCMWL
jgi:hypothetical protein